ncbi:hypothetical protein EJ110_NYTH59244 [Nymphaea thermarum]|nr:hypothetical protein EJ110_NYTH59244 [Nymphaea thermarum]
MAPRKAKTIEPETVVVEGEHVVVEETCIVERGESSGTNSKLDLILNQLAGVTQTIANMDGRLNNLEQRRDPPRSHTYSYYRRNDPIGAVSEAFLVDARRASLRGQGVEQPPRAQTHVPQNEPIQPNIQWQIIHPQLTNVTIQLGAALHVGERARREGERLTPEEIRRAFLEQRQHQERQHHDEHFHMGPRNEGPRGQHENRSMQSMTFGEFEEDLDREIEMMNGQERGQHPKRLWNGIAFGRRTFRMLLGMFSKRSSYYGLEISYVNHEIELRNLKQTSTIQDYQSKFERLSSMVKNRPVESKIAHFIGGLNEDIQIEMLRDPPTELRKCFALAKTIEEQFKRRGARKKAYKSGFVSKPKTNFVEATTGVGEMLREVNFSIPSLAFSGEGGLLHCEVNSSTKAKNELEQSGERVAIPREAKGASHVGAPSLDEENSDPLSPEEEDLGEFSLDGGGLGLTRSMHDPDSDQGQKRPKPTSRIELAKLRRTWARWGHWPI